jgi:3-dehydroquinate synthase class II
MATWGVKVSEDLKNQLSNIMKATGLQGEEFMEHLVTLYQTEFLKQQKPKISVELDELQKLTQRIHTMYINANERTDNLILAKESSFEATLDQKESEIAEWKLKYKQANEELGMMKTAYNNAIVDKEEAEKQCRTLDDLVKNQKIIIHDRDNDITRLAELIATYQQHEKEFDALKKSFESLEGVQPTYV